MSLHGFVSCKRHLFGLKNMSGVYKLNLVYKQVHLACVFEALSVLGVYDTLWLVSQLLNNVGLF